ncbi:peptide/nickel transport system substrate-binding protein [Azospirillum brasilense]|uniref:Peptide/nickel transport system substrate-binding protein n=1 Tax=Azospirillum brasilense TaxID=192 RepID=A0A560B400_AZOBR|nr:ABC transporter substrate-binding protein [Azospirillum brasilense]TWA67358.1 peptide/nickel transport system substrate-binding protein [Azospirillum brasilense]
MVKRLVARAVLSAFLLSGTALSAQAAGTLKVAVDSNLNTLDPAKMKGGQEYVAAYLLFNGLTAIAADMTLKPDLAERWEHSADLKTWTFFLKKGVKFHSGREMDAEDVLATIARIQDKATGSTARVNFEIVEAMKAVDSHTVEFTLKSPYSGFAELFGERQARIVPRDALDTLASNPVGTGPFQFVSFAPGDRMVVKRNPTYFEAGLPKLDEVVIRILPETASQVAALTTGELDLAWNLPPEAVDKVKATSNLKAEAVPTSTWDGVIMNGTTKPFDDVRVRRAVATALDKQAITQIALFGYGTPTHSPIPPSHPYFNKDLPIAKGDPAAAKKMLAEAGYPNGFEVTLYTPAGRATRERLGLAVRELLKPAGITVNVQRVPFDVFLKDIEGKAGFYIDGFFSRPTIDTSVYPWYHSRGSWNAALWNYANPAMDKLLDGARQASSEEEAKKLYGEVQALAVQDAPGVIPYVINHVNGVSARVQGFTSHPMMFLDLRNVSVGQ